MLAKTVSNSGPMSQLDDMPKRQLRCSSSRPSRPRIRLVSEWMDVRNAAQGPMRVSANDPTAGAEEPGLLQALRYLLLTFRALKRTSGGRRAAGRMPPETVDLAERLLLPDPDPAPLPAEVGAIPFDESSVQSLAQARLVITRLISELGFKEVLWLGLSCHKPLSCLIVYLDPALDVSRSGRSAKCCHLGRDVKSCAVGIS